MYQAFIQFDSTLPPFRYTRGYQRLDQTLELHTDDEFTTIGSVKFFHVNLLDDPCVSLGVRALDRRTAVLSRYGPGHGRPSPFPGIQGSD